VSTATRHSLADLLAIMARLRDPERGCPWDLQQDFSTIAPYTIEEAYEVADAIDRQDWHELRDELGDLLLQVVFHSQMAQEQGLFDFDDVAHAISEKCCAGIRMYLAMLATQTSKNRSVPGKRSRTPSAQRKARHTMTACWPASRAASRNGSVP
jgi:NTP pyrophosphatase (non-canonical NTP hydrolase)